MNFDLGCLVVAALFALWGAIRGLVRQVFGVLGFVGGIVAARFFAAPLAELVGPSVGLSPSLATVACAIGIFIVCEIVAKLLGNFLHDHLGTITGAADKLGGAGIGLGKGLLIVWTVASLVGLMHRQAPQLEKKVPALAKLDLAHSRAVQASADASALGDVEEQLKGAQKKLQQGVRKASAHD